jgi:hypothetical protein
MLKNVFLVNSVVSSTRYNENCFKLTPGEEKVDLTFEVRIMAGKLPTELTLAYSIIKSMHLSGLAYGIVSINNRVTYYK